MAKFCEPGFFLAMNGLGILIVAGLVAAGVALRRKPEWHKRLMLMSTITILGPRLGRLLPIGSLGAVGGMIL